MLGLSAHAALLGCRTNHLVSQMGWTYATSCVVPTRRLWYLEWLPHAIAEAEEPRSSKTSTDLESLLHSVIALFVNEAVLESEPPLPCRAALPLSLMPSYAAQVLPCVGRQTLILQVHKGAERDSILHIQSRVVDCKPA